MALINLRNALMTGKRLPYDAKVEYLESTGTQWIDTGVFMNTNTRVQMTARPGTVSCMLFGIFYRPGASGTTTYRFSVQNVLSPNRLFLFAGTGTHTYVRYTSGRVIDIGLDGSNGTYAIDDTSGTVDGQASFSAASSLLVFARKRFVEGESSAIDLAPMQLYSMRIYEGATLVRDFIPVRVGTTGELYDRVNGKFAERHGDFVFGSDVSASSRGGYKRQCVRRFYRRSLRPSARFWRRTLWKEVA